MSITVTADQVRHLRLLAQHLGGAELPADPAAVVRAVFGVQAQEAPAAALAIRARSAGLTAVDVERARVEERTIVRTWAMRGTLHLVPGEDLRWLLELLGPVFIRADRRRRAELGLDDECCARGMAAVREALSARGPLTRAELMAALDAGGIHLDGQAPVHLLAYATFQGAICYGPQRGAQTTYVLVDDWLAPAPAMPPEAALATLARRYLEGYGPAGPADLAAWSGLPAAQARQGWQAIESELIELTLDGDPLWLLNAHIGRLDAPRLPHPSVRLLGRYDTHLLGYRRRDLAVAPEHARRVNDGGGIVHPVLLVDGRAAGTWTSTRRRDAIEIAVTPFAPLDADVVAGVEREAADIGRFLGLTPARLRLQANRLPQ